MANTDKQNFRCDGPTRWDPAMRRLAQLRAKGYDVDMTMVLGRTVDWIRDASNEDIVKGLGLGTPKAAA